jgi:DNA replication protein DnaC
MTCKLCNGKGYIQKEVDGYDTVEPCICSQRNQLEHFFRKACIPPRYWNSTLQGEGTDAFDIPFDYKKWILSSPLEDTRVPFKPWSGPGKGNTETFHSQFHALKRCRDLLKLYLKVFLEKESPAEVPGLLMMGTVGIGKTHLLCTLLGDLIYAGVTHVYFTEMTDLMKKLQFSYNPGSLTKEQDILDPLIKSEVLVLDDLGSFGSGNQTWILNTLGYILNKRYSFNKPTLISTNYFDHPPEGERGLTDCLGTRLRSRIRETCPELVMKGFDYREYGKVKAPQAGRSPRKRSSKSKPEGT